MSRDLVLGLDGGGSKTVVALANRDGAVTALHHGPGLDPFGNPQWRRDLAALVEAIGTGGGDLRRAVLGLSCHAEMKDVSDAQREAARRLFDVGVDVLNDVHVAFEGALAGRAGVLSLAGTGSMAWAGDGRGLHRRTGGWGDLIGDEGSGYWIGREALSDITRTIDGRSDHAAFARSLLEQIGVDQHGLLAWVYGLPHRRSGIAALAVMVDGLADAGDPTAARLMARAADELSRQVRAAWRLIGSPEPLIWSYAGQRVHERFDHARHGRSAGSAHASATPAGRRCDPRSGPAFGLGDRYGLAQPARCLARGSDPARRCSGTT